MIDPSGTYFINLSYLLTSRDNLRQANADLLELAKAVPTISYDGNPTGDFDGSRVEFVGQSLGSIIGTAFMAVAHRGQTPMCKMSVCSMFQVAAWRGCSMLRRHSVRRFTPGWHRLV